MNNSKDTLLKWRSPLLLLVLSALLFESLSGFVLFFFGEFVEDSGTLVNIHWILGAVALIPYAIYQWRHYCDVRQFRTLLHYKIGLYTFLTVCIVSASGVPLIFNLNRAGGVFIVVDLIHVVSSFAFLILLSGHLVLVAKIALTKTKKKVPANAGTLSVIGRRILWFPLIASILTLLLIPLISIFIHN